MKKGTLLPVLMLSAALAAGCGATAAPAPEAPAAEAAEQEAPEQETPEQEAPAGETAEAAAEAEVQEAEEAAEEADAAPYFTKGVYVNYAKEDAEPAGTYFYVFEEDDYGYTADGENHGIGAPFDVEQAGGGVNFYFGGAEEETKFLTVTSAADGLVTGAFEDRRELVFERLEGEDPAAFSAENYVNGPENSVYYDPNGWNIRYDATKFEITQDGPQVFIVYTGESAGTNMITVTYSVETNGEEAVKALGEPYGDRAEYSEGPFPGAEGVTGYWVSIPVDKEGSGSYMTAVARDFMDGSLTFELDGHNGENEEQNMEVGDLLAGVMDSISFE